MPDSPRQSSSNADRRPCNPMQRGATPRNTVQPQGAFGKTNPIFTADADPLDPISAALNRATESVLGSMAPAVRAACNVVQPGATPCNPMQPNRDMRKTNPIPPAAGFASSVGRSVARNPPPRPTLGRDAQATKAAPLARNAMQPHGTLRNATQPNHAARKTNPFPPDDRFDARQLAAARLLATGRSMPDVARELNVARSTVWRWQRDPAFRAELRRIHERMIAAGARR